MSLDHFCEAATYVAVFFGFWNKRKEDTLWNKPNPIYLRGNRT